MRGGGRGRKGNGKGKGAGGAPSFGGLWRGKVLLVAFSSWTRKLCLGQPHDHMVLKDDFFFLLSK